MSVADSRAPQTKLKTVSFWTKLFNNSSRAKSYSSESLHQPKLRLFLMVFKVTDSIELAIRNHSYTLPHKTQSSVSDITSDSSEQCSFKGINLAEQIQRCHRVK